MVTKEPTTIAEYIKAAPPTGQQHLLRLYELLKSIAPDAEETIKWKTPFFVEPRFLFAFSAHKAHLGFIATADGSAPFHEELKEYQTTKGILKVPHQDPLPEDLIRRIAERRLRVVSECEDDSFW